MLDKYKRKVLTLSLIGIGIILILFPFSSTTGKNIDKLVKFIAPLYTGTSDESSLTIQNSKESERHSKIIDKEDSEIYFVQKLNRLEQMKFFRKMIKQRQSLIRKAVKRSDLQTYILDQISCSTAVRVGEIGDGGKWVCNPWMVREPCIVYSMGIKNQFEFERQLFDITKNRCRIYCFDVNSENLENFKSFNGTFKQWKVSKVTNENKSEWAILDIKNYFNHTKISFLKIDIEGAEYDSLIPVLNSEFVITGKICQIMVEMHDDVNPQRRLQLEFEMAGFLMFHNEPNYYCATCSEYAYIHQACLKEYGVPNFIFNKNFK